MTIERDTRHWKKPSRTKTRGGRRSAAQTNIAEEIVEGYQPHPGRRMTEEEFVAWVGEKTRAEWVDGEVIIMSPVSYIHSNLNGWLTTILRTFIESHDLGQIQSDVMVRLSKPLSRRVPDIYFFSRERSGLQQENHFEGPPDVIFEIVSPDSTARDYRDKLRSYEASGVKEYWIIDPLVKRLEANELVRGRYKSIEERQGALHSKAIKGFFLRPAWCWQTPLPRVAEVLRELGAK
jgi:Uma2 family endonuclease